MRYKFARDDDGHWYLIPVYQAEMFYKILHEGEDDCWCEFNNSFGEYRCDHPTDYTFENPE